MSIGIKNEKMFFKGLLVKSFLSMYVFKALYSIFCDLDTFFSILRVFLKGKNVGGNYFNVFSLKLWGRGVDVASLNQILQKLIGSAE